MKNLAIASVLIAVSGIIQCQSAFAKYGAHAKDCGKNGNNAETTYSDGTSGCVGKNGLIHRVRVEGMSCEDSCTSQGYSYGGQDGKNPNVCQCN